MTLDTRLFTAEELLRLPDDGSRYELVQGELRKMSPSGSEHSRIAVLIAASLLAHVTKHRLGAVFGADCGFLLTRHPDTLRSPDAAYVSAERFIKTEAFFPGAPDLAVEVMSPSDLASEVSFKTSQYLRAGTRAVVVVDLEKRIVYVHRSSGTDVLTKIADNVLELDDVVPGWKMSLTEIFEA
ncbi:MAG TPA: Uma2 family endonuclease [Thermoanaerobaculia bacterium]|nr:Uma2 family endonuclease [Thermoanaerobaculia bacterium]